MASNPVEPTKPAPSASNPMAANPTAAIPTVSNKWLRILGYVSLSGLLLILGVVVYASTLPDDFQYERSAVMKAPADAVFPLINNFHEWAKWSPWEKIDPKLQRSYEGPESGKGAKYKWVGNADVGEGEMTIEESKPNELIAVKLEFFKPFAGVCPTTFKLEPAAEGTKVTWTMKGKNQLISKIMCLFIDMEQMIGKNFEDGLTKLEQAAQENLKQGVSQEPNAAASKDVAVDKAPTEQETLEAGKPAETKEKTE